jgi:hypothetical protein
MVAAAVDRAPHLERNPALPVLGCIVYLLAAADIGERLEQIVDCQVVQAWPLRAVRLWEHDAQAAVRGGAVGLTVLSPLMANASAELVAQAAQQVLAQAPPEQQADLLVILGVFGEPLLPAAGSVRLVGKERLIMSDLVHYVLHEQVAEREARYVDELQRTLEATIAARFPDAPLRFAPLIHDITRTETLHQLIVAVVQAADVMAVEQALGRAADTASS